MNRRRIETPAGKPIQATSISVPTTRIVIPVTDARVSEALIAGGLAAFQEGADDD